MRLRWTPRARRELHAYIYHLAAENPHAAACEAKRVRDALEHFASLPADGTVVVIEDAPRPVRRWFLHPFHVYYERCGGIFRILRLYHHARRPIERPI